MMRKSKRAFMGLAALMVVTLVGGTWAAWTQELQTGNEFQTARYDTTLDENFESPDDWQPGIEETKEVWVSNDSTIPVIAKISIDQNWIRREDVYAVISADGTREKVKPFKGEKYPLTFDGGEGLEYAAQINWNEDAVVVLESGRNPDPGLRFHLNSVASADEAKGKWLLVSETAGDDGQFDFYYIGEIEPGGKTPYLLNSVTMNPKLENTVTGSNTYYVKEDNGYRQVTVDSVNPEYGYDSATYTLNVKATTVQSTKAAVGQILATGAAGSSIVDYLSGYIAGSGEYTSESVKRLYFTEENGTMTYTPYRDGQSVENGNWFMSFTNMVPGGIYHDQLSIENGSNKNYDLFMEIVPREQEQIKNELLEQISMSIYYNDQLIYNGKATGSQYGEGENMQQVVALGYYGSKSSGNIRVDLMLNPDLALEDDGTFQYADVLTKIDWKFMVQEHTSTTPVNPGGNDNGGSSGGGGDTNTIIRTITDGNTPAGSAVPVESIVTIDDEEVPLTAIPDEGVPLAAMVPKTGDTQPVTMALILFAISGLSFMGMLWTLVRSRRKES